ncbi:response regulator [Aeromonas caviae]|uniref:response regulator n=1 Tax=Aeromonas caviae TaxID=648 RepID=UPI0038CF5652
MNNAVSHVVLADGQAAVLAGLRSVVLQSPLLTVTGMAQTIAELMELLRRVPCDVLVCDFTFYNDPMSDGIPLIRQLRHHYPHITLIVLSSYDNVAMVRQLMGLGIRGFISKTSSDITQLPEIIRLTVQGESFVDSQTSKTLLNHIIDNGSTGHDSIAELSRREIEVVQLVVSGMSVTEIAAYSERHLKTISGQKKNAMRKLGVHTDSELINVWRKMNYREKERG